MTAKASSRSPSTPPRPRRHPTVPACSREVDLPGHLSRRRLPRRAVEQAGECNGRRVGDSERRLSEV
jgi:hypothetical protein